MEYTNDYAQLRPYLYEGEQLRWAGRPVSANPLRKADILLIPFSVLWFGFAVFWECTALQNDAPLLFKLWGIPFVLIGLYISAGRLIVAAIRLKKTLYAVTDRRVIRVVGESVESIAGIPLSQMKVSARKDGTGTISFYNTYTSRSGFFADTRFIEIRSIERPTEVQRLILDIAAG